MKIVLAFDDNYAPHAATVIESILDNTTQTLSFALLYRKLDATILTAFRRHFETRVASIDFIEIDPDLLLQVSHTQTAVNLTIDTYLRLFAPQVLPDDEFIIYLDCDTIVLDDIGKIIEKIDFSQAVYAVKESDPNYKLKGWAQVRPIERPIAPYLSMEAYLYRLRHHLGMAQEAPFFNAGVLIFNLRLWRELELTQQVLEYIAQNPRLNNGDQDALNAVLNGQFGELAPRWNNGILMFGLMAGYDTSLLHEARYKPAVVHFLGLKPWSYMCSHPHKKAYLKYRKLTPWPTNIYQDRTFRNIITKHLVHPLRIGLHKIAGICPLCVRQRLHTPQPGFFDLTYLQK